MFFNQNNTALTADGSIEVNLQPELDVCFRVSSWDNGVNFYFKEDNTWTKNDYDPGLFLIDNDYQESSSPVSQYLKTIPKKILVKLSRYQYKQFMLLSYLSNYPRLQDIFNHSPNLVWLVICIAHDKQWGQEKIIELLHQKREKIIEQLTDRRSVQAVRFLARIKLSRGTLNEYRLIYKSLTNARLIKSLSHWKTIPVHVLAVVKKMPLLLNTQLLYILSDLEISVFKRTMKIINQTIEDMYYIAGETNINLPDNYFRNLKSEEDLYNAHDRMVTRFNKKHKNSESEIVIFPPCPLGSTSDFIQIRNNIELIQEGRQMSHCVGGHVRRAKTGSAFYYRLLKPERATVQIGVRNKKVAIQQFKLTLNKEPSEDSWVFLKSVLDELCHKL